MYADWILTSAARLDELGLVIGDGVDAGTERLPGRQLMPPPRRIDGRRSRDAELVDRLDQFRWSRDELLRVP